MTRPEPCHVVRLAREAMGCRWELLLLGDEPVRLRGAGEEALDEIERLDRQLSRFRAGSAIADINARAATTPVAVEPGLFGLLQRCVELWARTGGAFDISVGPLLAAWDLHGQGRVPSEVELAEARARVGLDKLELDAAARTVRFAVPGMQLDLGGAGKGYALDRAAAILGDLGVAAALLHAGTSSVAALGAPTGQAAWPVALADPADGATVAVLPLAGACLGVSGAHGRGFRAAGRYWGHVLDPRSGAPAETPVRLAAVIASSGLVADALSTAAVVGGLTMTHRLVADDPALAATVVYDRDVLHLGERHPSATRPG